VCYNNNGKRGYPKFQIHKKEVNKMKRTINTNEIKKGMVIEFEYGCHDNTVKAIVDYTKPYDEENIIIGFHYGKGWENGDQIRECVHKIKDKIIEII
jgi:hypothetical protein